MKKFFLISLIIIVSIFTVIFEPMGSCKKNKVFAAAPQLPDDWFDTSDCQGKSQQECFDKINDDLKDKEIKRKAPKRPPRNPTPFGLGISLLSNVLIGTTIGDEIEELENEFWNKVDELDQYLYERLDPHKDKVVEALQNSLLSGNFARELATQYFDFEYLPLDDAVYQKVAPDLYTAWNNRIHEFNYYYNGPIPTTDKVFRTYTINKNDEGRYVIRGMRMTGIFYIYNREEGTFTPRFSGSDFIPTGSGTYAEWDVAINNRNLFLKNYINRGSFKAALENLTLSRTYPSPEPDYNLFNYSEPLKEELPQDENGNLILPEIKPESIPGIEGARLLNPNDMTVTEVDGKPYIEIDFVPDPTVEPAPGAPPLTPPEVPTNPWLIPFDPSLPPIPVFPNNPYNVPIPDPGHDPVPDPGHDPIPDPVPDPGQDPLPDPGHDPIPDPVPDPGTPGPNPDGEFECEREYDGEKWQEIITGISNKFPFSIPWDIGRAINSFFGGMGTEKPSFVLTVGSTEWKITIPELIDNWMPFVKSVMVFSFDVAIIYALRKWWGGQE